MYQCARLPEQQFGDFDHSDVRQENICKHKLSNKFHKMKYLVVQGNVANSKTGLWIRVPLCPLLSDLFLDQVLIQNLLSKQCHITLQVPAVDPDILSLGWRLGS